MFRNIFSKLENIQVFPIFTMILFMIIFIGIIYYVIKMNNKTIKHISNLPLENNEDSNKNNNGENK